MTALCRFIASLIIVSLLMHGPVTIMAYQPDTHTSPDLLQQDIMPLFIENDRFVFALNGTAPQQATALRNLLTSATVATAAVPGTFTRIGAEGSPYILYPFSPEITNIQLAEIPITIRITAAGAVALGAANLNVNAIFHNVMIESAGGHLTTTATANAFTVTETLLFGTRLQSTGGAGRGIVVQDGGTLIFDRPGSQVDGFRSTNTDFGGGVTVQGAGTRFTMNAGRINNNHGGLGGGGVRVQNGADFIMTGGRIDNNNTIGALTQSNNGGGGVRVQSGATFTLNGGTSTVISNTTADFTASNTDAVNGLFAIIENNNISGGTALTTQGGAGVRSTRGGAGVFVTGVGTTFNMYGGNVRHNRIGSHSISETQGSAESSIYGGGGGVRVALGATFNMSSGMINNNHATGGGNGSWETGGGGVMVADVGTTFNMSGGSITANSRPGWLPNYGDRSLILSESANESTINNGAGLGRGSGTGGGGLYVARGATANLSGNAQITNNASRRGGGISSEGLATSNGAIIQGVSTWNANVITRINISDSVLIANNRALEGWDNASAGGIFVGPYTIVNMYDGTIEGNRVTNTVDSYAANGGGVRITSRGHFILHGGSIRNNEALHVTRGTAPNRVPRFAVGGGVAVRSDQSGIGNHARFTMYGGSIYENRAGRGGGIGMNANSTVEITGGVIRNNYAVGWPATGTATTTGGNGGGGIATFESTLAAINSALGRLTVGPGVTIRDNIVVGPSRVTSGGSGTTINNFTPSLPANNSAAALNATGHHLIINDNFFRDHGNYAGSPGRIVPGGLTEGHFHPFNNFDIGTARLTALYPLVGVRAFFDNVPADPITGAADFYAIRWEPVETSLPVAAADRSFSAIIPRYDASFLHWMSAAYAGGVPSIYIGREYTGVIPARHFGNGNAIGTDVSTNNPIMLNIRSGQPRYIEAHWEDTPRIPAALVITPSTATIYPGESAALTVRVQSQFYTHADKDRVETLPIIIAPNVYHYTRGGGHTGGLNIDYNNDAMIFPPQTITWISDTPGVDVSIMPDGGMYVTVAEDVVGAITTLTGAVDGTELTEQIVIRVPPLVVFQAGPGGSFGDGQDEVIIFPPNGSVLAAEDTPIPVPDTAAGYMFSHWEPSNPVGQTVSGEMVFTAIFTQNTDTMPITFTAGLGGSLAGTLTISRALGYVLTAADIPTPVPNTALGYMFTGWEPSEPLGHEIVGAVTFTATFAQNPDTIPITFAAGPGGSLSGTLTIGRAIGYVLTDMDIPTPVPDVTLGYIFTGWEESEPFGHEVSDTVIFTAIFAQNPDTVSIGFVTGSGSISINRAIGYVLTASDVPIPMPNISLGYIFTGWEPHEPVGHEVTGPMTFTATFAQNPDTVPITFVAGPGGNLTGSLTISRAIGYVLTASDIPTPVPHITLGYMFTGWEASVPLGHQVEGAITFTATFAQNPDTVPITFVAGPGGSLAGTLTVNRAIGYILTASDIPDPVPNIALGYIFTGWLASEPSGHEVAGAVTFTATFHQNPDTVPITFIAGSGGSLTGTLTISRAVGYVLTPATGIPTPVPNTALGYMFTGWETGEPLGHEVEGAVTFTATFAQNPDTVPITFIAGPGGSLAGVQVIDRAIDYVLTASDIPAPVPDIALGYVFTGWEPTVPLGHVVAGAVTFTATFSQNPDTVLINFTANPGGSLSGTLIINRAIGYVLTTSDIPIPEPSIALGYMFTGWQVSEPLGHEVEGAVTFTATFAQNPDTVPITFVTGLGGSLVGATVINRAAGFILTASDIPIPVPNVALGYVFTGWSATEPLGHEVEGAITFTATFSQNPDTVPINFVAGSGGSLDGTLIISRAIGYVLTSATGIPTPVPHIATGYMFTGWETAEPLGHHVEGAVTFTATFAQNPDTVPITFVASPGGTLAGTLTINRAIGYVLTASDIPTPVPNVPLGYVFTGWQASEPLGHAVTGTITFTATFAQNPNTVPINFVAGPGGSLAGTLIINRAIGYVLTISDIPIPEPSIALGYIFTGWQASEPVGHEVEGAVTFTATFAQNPDTVSITFVAGPGGSLAGTLTINRAIGYVLTASDIPTPVPNGTLGYVFTGWESGNPLGHTVNGTVTFTATFAQNHPVSVHFTANPIQGTISGSPIYTIQRPLGSLLSGHIPAPEPNTGWMFLRWELDGVPVDPSTISAADGLTFTAIFIQSESTITTVLIRYFDVDQYLAGNFNPLKSQTVTINTPPGATISYVYTVPEELQLASIHFSHVSNPLGYGGDVRFMVDELLEDWPAMNAGRTIVFNHIYGDGRDHIDVFFRRNAVEATIRHAIIDGTTVVLEVIETTLWREGTLFTPSLLTPSEALSNHGFTAPFEFVGVATYGNPLDAAQRDTRFAARQLVPLEGANNTLVFVYEVQNFEPDIYYVRHFVYFGSERTLIDTNIVSPLQGLDSTFPIYDTEYEIYYGPAEDSDGGYNDTDQYPDTEYDDANADDDEYNGTDTDDDGYYNTDEEDGSYYDTGEEPENGETDTDDSSDEETALVWLETPVHVSAMELEDLLNHPFVATSISEILTMFGPQGITAPMISSDSSIFSVGGNVLDLVYTFRTVSMWHSAVEVRHIFLNNGSPITLGEDLFTPAAIGHLFVPTPRAFEPINGNNLTLHSFTPQRIVAQNPADNIFHVYYDIASPQDDGGSGSTSITVEFRELGTNNTLLPGRAYGVFTSPPILLDLRTFPETVGSSTEIIVNGLRYGLVGNPLRGLGAINNVSEYTFVFEFEMIGTTHFTVVFNLNDSTGSTVVKTVPKYTTVDPWPADPTRPHYTFAGWFAADGIHVTGSTIITSSKTVYARWIPLEQPVVLPPPLPPPLPAPTPAPPIQPASPPLQGRPPLSHIRQPTHQTSPALQDRPQLPPTLAYYEVPTTGHYIEVFRRHFVSGYPDGTFRPNGHLTRAEMIQIFSNIEFNAPVLAFVTHTRFSDVSTDAWYFRAVARLENLGVIQGFPDGTLRPNEAITNAEFAAMATKFFDLSDIIEPDMLMEAESHWAANYINIGFARGWFEYFGITETFDPDAPITRAQAVALLNFYQGRVPNPEAINELLANTAYDFFPDLDRNHWSFYEVMEAVFSRYYLFDSLNREVWVRVIY